MVVLPDSPNFFREKRMKNAAFSGKFGDGPEIDHWCETTLTPTVHRHVAIARDDSCFCCCETADSATLTLK